MNESIYNLVPREYVPAERQTMHKSSFDPKAQLTGSTFGCRGTTRLPGAGALVKSDGAFFGPRKDELDSERTYLRKSIKKELSASDYQRKSASKPSLPSKDDRPVMGIHTSKNFITANAVEAILQAPRVVEATNPNYMKKEDFGKVPAYLTHVKEEIRRENEMIDKYVNEQMGYKEKDPEQFDEMDEYDRRELIEQLKIKWNAVNANYQKMTHLIDLDTIGQVRRKETMENQLKQLEGDIERLQRNGPVLIR